MTEREVYIYIVKTTVLNALQLYYFDVALVLCDGQISIKTVWFAELSFVLNPVLVLQIIFRHKWNEPVSI